jgi:MacB-like periplasmic core domain
MTAAGSHGPVSISGAFVSGDFFKVLRTTPLRGRLLTPDDDRPDAAPVAIVTEYFWRTHLDGRDEAIGRPVLLGGTSFTVIGVAPPRFHGMQPLDPGQDDSNGVQAWIPLALAPQWPNRPSLDTGWLTVVGRVKAGLTTTDVERQLTVSAARIASSHPPSPRLRRGHAEASAEAEPTTRATAAPLVRAHGFGPNDAPIQIFALVIALLALPLIVLAIGCANVANLHLARVAEQSRELAVRLALGATPVQLVKLLTLETLARVLVAVGLSIGLLLLTLSRVQAMVPVFVSIDWRVLLFAVSLALGVSLTMCHPSVRSRARREGVREPAGHAADRRPRCDARRHERRLGRRHGGQASHRPAADRCGRPHGRHAEREGRRDDRARDVAARDGASRCP